ncbi:hypothetical protein HPB50_017077 [Hyalomma asiaticum]|uniref:Uncharacterized protein n=1 Tax=Hyalomma asiaticum TaxID=266040 RepID=A0ACB7SZB5_HYAAI|nr:hypothetical protein HPB50_017077 [Hyalomma asiaticum]
MPKAPYQKRQTSGSSGGASKFTMRGNRAAAVKDNERITGFCYLSKWRQRILNLVGRLPHTSCPACEAHEDSADGGHDERLLASRPL